MNQSIETTATLEQELLIAYRNGPSDQIASDLDRRFMGSLERQRNRSVRSRRRLLPLATALALLAALTFGGATVAEHVLAPNEPRGLPGVTNFGQPLWGVDLQALTPARVEEIATDKGYAVRWQIENYHGVTGMGDNYASTVSETAPECGLVEGGGVVDRGLIQLVVRVNDPSFPDSAC
jgi:hypothetical protein